MTLKAGVLWPREIVPAGQEPATGLQRPFPLPVTRPDNPTTPDRVQLGRLLFFDPILSGDNKMSCAHCHHPDLGLSDGQARARGFGSTGVGPQRTGGVELSRAAPSLWNALYNGKQYWDGRAKDLEDQAQFPITAPDEMGATREQVVQKLKAVPEYVRLFDRAFGGRDGSNLTFESVTYAIAAFERTLVTFNSRFDRYAAGDISALTAEERHGLKLFLSTRTRCAECHGLPNFANQDFKVIGVPQPTDGPADTHRPTADPGRGGGPNSSYKIPTLRNVALSAPYMHNGLFRTLEEVIDFYAKGGGRGHGLTVPAQDDKIRKYDLTTQEKADIVAFLKSLTDLSAIPAFPRRLPSGLPVVPRIRTMTAEVARGTRLAAYEPLAAPPGQRAARAGMRIDVHPGHSIQDALDRAGRNGTVRIFPGEYHEDLLSIHHGVTIEGVVQDNRRPVLDGKNVMNDAVVALGSRFSISNLEIRNYRSNGIIVHGGKGVTFRNLTVQNPGTYAVYPVECDGVLVEGCTVSGAKDAGIYVGQSRNIIVRNNEVFQCVAGVEIENSVHALVEGNYLHDNTGGLLVFLLPFNVSKEGTDCKVTRNRVLHNNVPNFADKDAFVQNVVVGSGITIFAADRTEVTENEVAENHSFGIAVASLKTVFPPETRFDVDPFPDENWIHGNTLRANGKDPDPRLKKIGAPGCDLLWDLSGKNNAWDQPGATCFPGKLPARKATASAPPSGPMPGR